MKPDEFIRMIAPSARVFQKKHGIYASVTIAQAALETGWGKFIPVDRESGQNSYNLFGAKGEGSAGSVRCKTWEVRDGVRSFIEAEFRAYNSFEESLADHFDVLLQTRYIPVRKANTPEEAAQQLYKCGYTIDPKYPEKLVSVIDQYHLKQNDIILPVPGPFLDVPGGHPAARFVAAVKEAEIMAGGADGNFEGERAVTRYELAVILAKALKLVK